MKKLIIFCVAITLSFSYTFSQGINIFNGEQLINNSYFIGSLPESSSTTHQKLKLEIMGGSLHSDNVGSTTYYISTRDGNVINMERRGGDSGCYEIKVYKISGGYDFTIKLNTTYASLWVQAWKIESGMTPTAMLQTNITLYNTSGKTDVTSSFPIRTILATTNTGNIGIGTKTPREKLEVAGTIRATEIKVMAQTADFVFEDNYELRPLDEVEAFINDNGHLPDIPKATEMEKDGIALAEMNKLLLQKIEELTLYIIEQEKQNKKQQDLLERQQEQIQLLLEK